MKNRMLNGNLSRGEICHKVIKYKYTDKLKPQVEHFEASYVERVPKDVAHRRAWAMVARLFICNRLTMQTKRK